MDDSQHLHRNGVKVDTLYRAVRDSQAAELVPQLVCQILAEGMWHEHIYEQTGETFRFDVFQDFVETHPPDGLGTKVENLFKLCLDDDKATELLDRVLESTDQTKSGDDPVIKRPAISTARQAGLRRLRRYAEQNEAIASLRQSVLDGKMSVNAALVAAGLRKPRITIPRDLTRATEALKRIYNSDELRQLAKSINDMGVEASD